MRSKRRWSLRPVRASPPLSIEPAAADVETSSSAPGSDGSYAVARRIVVDAGIARGGEAPMIAPILTHVRVNVIAYLALVLAFLALSGGVYTAWFVPPNR